MRKFIYVISVITLLLLSNCQQVKKNVFIDGTHTIYTIENLNNKFLNWDSILTVKKVIPLETTDESAIGYFYKGSIHEDKIFLMDRKNFILLEFDINGNFIRKIGARGKGPKEYLELRDYCINDKIIYTLDYQKIHSYDIVSGSYKNQIDFKSDKGFNPSNLLVYDEKNYYLWNSNPDVWEPNKGRFYRLKKYKDNKVIDKLFEYQHKTSDDNRFYECGNRKYFIKPVDGEYKIYKITSDSVASAFEIDFGKKALSPEEIEKLRNSKERNAYLNSNFYKDISNILLIKDYLYFGCIGPESERYEGLINMKTGEICFGRWDFARSPHIFYSDGNFLYGYYEPSTLLEVQDNENHINSCFDNITKEITNLKIDDNLVIVRLSIK
jgi:hypothetical protein